MLQPVSVNRNDLKPSDNIECCWQRRPCAFLCSLLLLMMFYFVIFLFSPAKLLSAIPPYPLSVCHLLIFKLTFFGADIDKRCQSLLLSFSFYVFFLMCVFVCRFLYSLYRLLNCTHTHTHIPLQAHAFMHFGLLLLPHCNLYGNQQPDYIVS